MFKNPININTLPIKTPGSYTYNFNFANGSPFEIPIGNEISKGAISKNIQSIWIDNSKNGDALNVSINTTSQEIVCPPNYQGMFPFLISDSASGIITITSTSTTAAVILILIDVPVDFITWNSLGTSSGGVIDTLVTNTSTQAVPVQIENTTSTMVPVQTYPVFNNGAGTTYTTNESIAYLTASAALTLAEEVIMIPASTVGSTFFLDGISLSLTTNSNLAAAGEETVTFYDGATVLFSFQIYVPLSATNITPTMLTIPTKYHSMTQNSAFSVGLSTALAAGVLNVVVNYAYTSL